MVSGLECFLLVVSIVLLVPVGVLAAEVVAALLPRRAPIPERPPGVRCAVLVPAHNEEACLGATLASVKAQLGPGDWILVVADNCTDRTAEIARAAGAAVAERQDPGRRGKGYALDFGVRALEPDPPDVVLVLDADCLVQPGVLDHLAGAALGTGLPAQAVYLLEPPLTPTVRSQLSAFAFRLKNLVRPLGLERLGMPCLLTGTGMAFPWTILQRASLASCNLVEDMQLGLDLARAGYPPRLCAPARVIGVLPSGRDAAHRQRVRWEHGHLRTLLTQVPRLLGCAAHSRRPYLVGLALELAVPPLSVLGLLYAAAGIVCVVAWAKLPGLVLGCGAAGASLTLFAAWVGFGRDCLPFSSLLTAPFYALGKVSIYWSFLTGPQRAWVRTARDGPSATPGATP